jgi:hypothetical protein
MIEDYATQHGIALVDVACRAVEVNTGRERKIVGAVAADRGESSTGTPINCAG